MAEEQGLADDAVGPQLPVGQPAATAAPDVPAAIFAKTTSSVRPQQTRLDRSGDNVVFHLRY
jgi:hypothetical protein